MEFRRANQSDLDDLMKLQAEFYPEDGYPHRVEPARRAWATLLKRHDLGEAWILLDDGVGVAYVVVTFSYSLEFLGRDAFVDELFVTRAFRGRGLGRQALQVAESICRQAGVRALHLEMERGKVAAAQLYRTWGFVDHSRALMTKWLEKPDD